MRRTRRTFSSIRIQVQAARLFIIMASDISWRQKLVSGLAAEMQGAFPGSILRDGAGGFSDPLRLVLSVETTESGHENNFNDRCYKHGPADSDGHG